MHKIHDYGYKYLFSHAGFVRQLMENFVPLAFVKDLDFNRMEKINASFIRKNFKNKESDVIWKVHYQNKEIYLYILLEFQSTVDHWMALRMLSYIIDLYEDLIKKSDLKKHKRTLKLPIVFPIMIYNGKNVWNAKTEIRDLIEISQKDMVKYIPSFEYFTVLINQFSKRSLYRLNNLLSGVFLVESISSDTEFKEHMQKIIDLLKKELDPQLKEGFINWIKRLEELGKRELEIPIQKIIKNQKEGTKMFKDFIEKVEERGIKKGLQQGVQQGVQQGMQQGLQQGMQQERNQVAYKLFNLGLDPDLIQKATGLSSEEIERYRKKNKK